MANQGQIRPLRSERYVTSHLLSLATHSRPTVTADARWTITTVRGGTSQQKLLHGKKGNVMLTGQSVHRGGIDQEVELSNRCGF